MHPGSLVTPEEEAVLHPEQVRTCASCSKRFYTPKGSSICWGCWYQLEMDTAESSFKPLSTWLERLLEIQTSVDQTGGMVMCLRVPIGRPDERGYTTKYAYFGEYPFDTCGVGLYHDGDEDLLEEEFHEFPDADGHMCGAGTCGWHHHPDLAKAVAEWAAPIILEFATRGDKT